MTITGADALSTDITTWLFDQFMTMLHRYEPRSVLDVGCGKGQLLRLCTERGIYVIGLDQPTEHMQQLKADGHDVREGTAYELPFDDRSIDWVLLRHIPHHLETPGSAFAEAIRVAGSGVVIAEPWYDITVASQRTALALEQWEKRQDRRGGMYHADVLSLGALFSHLPVGFDQQFEIEVRPFLLLRRRCIETFLCNTAHLISDLPEDHPERTSLKELVSDIRLDGLTWNGSLCLALRRK